MEELVTKAIRGDTNAYNDLINMVSNELYKIACIMLNNNIEDVNDVLQETILKGYLHLSELKEKEYFRTWIVKILINECNNLYIKHSKEQNILNKYVNNRDLKSYGNLVEEVDNNLDFKRMLKSLNTDEQTVITLYYKYKYKTSEIADILNENINTIKSRLLRAKEKIEKDIKKGGK